MAAKRGRKPRTAAVDIYAVTGLTHDELATLKRELEDVQVDPYPLPPERLLMTFGQEYEHAQRGEFYFHVPAAMFEKLKQLVEKLQRPWTSEEIKRHRWDTVRMLLDLNSSFEEACRIAAIACENDQAAAGPRMMGRAYQEWEKALPKGQRRPRTYRKRPPLTPARRECRDARGTEERLAAFRMLIREVESGDLELLRRQEGRLAKYLGVETLDNLTSSQFRRAVAAIERRREHLRQGIEVAGTSGVREALEPMTGGNPEAKAAN